jgi:hypothetical protein
VILREKREKDIKMRRLFEERDQRKKLRQEREESNKKLQASIELKYKQI